MTELLTRSVIPYRLAQWMACLALVGQVGCASHLPPPDRWEAHGWAGMTEEKVPFESWALLDEHCPHDRIDVYSVGTGYLSGKPVQVAFWYITPDFTEHRLVVDLRDESGHYELLKAVPTNHQ